VLTALLLLADNASFTNAASRFPRKISSKAFSIYNHVYNTAINSRSQSGVDPGRIGASGRLVRDVADYGDQPQHCKRLFYPAMMQAKHEILITTFTYDRHSPCGKATAQALLDLNKRHRGGPKLKVKFIISTLSELYFWKGPGIRLPRLQDFFAPLVTTTPKEFDLPFGKQVPNLDIEVKTFHKVVFGAIHSKLLIVDGHILVTGSKNIDAFYGFEYSAWFDGSIAMSARSDFTHAWGKDIGPAPSNAVTHPRRGELPMLYLPRVPNANLFVNRDDNPQDQAWIKAMQLAEKKVIIMSPNFTAKQIVSMTLDAVKRGIQVLVVTSFKYQDQLEYVYPFNEGSDKAAVDKMYQDLQNTNPDAVKNLNVCWFLGKRVQPPKPAENEMAHAKFMSVDDEFVIFGSGNQESQSWFHSREADVLVDDVKTTKKILARLFDSQQTLTHCFHDDNGAVDSGPLTFQL